MNTLILRENTIVIENISYTRKEDRDQLAIYFIGSELPLIVKNQDRDLVLATLNKHAINVPVKSDNIGNSDNNDDMSEV